MALQHQNPTLQQQQSPTNYIRLFTPSHSQSFACKAPGLPPLVARPRSKAFPVPGPTSSACQTTRRAQTSFASLSPSPSWKKENGPLKWLSAPPPGLLRWNSPTTTRPRAWRPCSRWHPLPRPPAEQVKGPWLMWWCCPCSPGPTLTSTLRHPQGAAPLTNFTPPPDPRLLPLRNATPSLYPVPQPLISMGGGCTRVPPHLLAGAN